MAAPRKGQAVRSTRTAGKSVPQPSNDTMVYMNQTLEMLTIPDAIDFDIPPLDLSDWQDPYANDSAVSFDFEDGESPESVIPPPRPSKLNQRSRGNSSSTSEERPIAAVAHSKSSKSNASPPKRKAPPRAESDAEEGQVSDVKIPRPSSKIKSESSPRPESKPKVKGHASPKLQPQHLPTQRPAKRRSPTPEEPQLPPHARATYFSKDKLKTLAMESRVRGRALKHSGDARMRSNPSTKDTHTSLLEQTDALLLYVYSFWADDLLAGRQDEHGRLTKPGCRSDNWHTIFGLLHHVRSRAERSHHLIVCLCDLTEGMILTHIQRFDRRMLHGMAQQAKTKLLASNATATSDGNPSGTTPQSNVPTPPADAASASVNEMHSKLQDTFLDLSAGIEKVFQLYRSAQDVLYLHGLKEHLPTFASKIGGASGPLGQAPADQMSEPARPWTFAFGIDTTVSYTSIGQLVCFGRAMLEEMAVQSQLEWRPEWEASDASH